MNLFPVIDYDSHPAFAGLAVRGQDQIADEMIQQIEAAYMRLCEQIETPEARIANFERDIASKINALLQHILESNTAGPQFKRFVTNAFANARQSLMGHLMARTHDPLQHNSGAVAVPSSLVNPLADFRRDGFYVTHNPALARRVWFRTMLERAQLRGKRKSRPTRHCVMPLSPHSPSHAAIADAMEAMGVRELAAAYLGKPVELYYAALDHSHDGQNWYKACYADANLGTPKAVYMHFDADCDIIKGLFYLQDVTGNDGPFRFVPGSHRWERPYFATAVQLGFDAASVQEFPACEDKLDYVSGYYRPRFQQLDQRRVMLSLPAALRGSTHFGDDLPDGSPLSDALLEKEHAFVAPAGTLVMFDGSRGIHRGGQVGEKGNRWAVQVAFRVVQAHQKRPRWRRIAGKVKGRILYLRDAIHHLPDLMGSK